MASTDLQAYLGLYSGISEHLVYEYVTCQFLHRSCSFLKNQRRIRFYDFHHDYEAYMQKIIIEEKII